MLSAQGRFILIGDPLVVISSLKVLLYRLDGCAGESILGKQVVVNLLGYVCRPRIYQVS